MCWRKFCFSIHAIITFILETLITGVGDMCMPNRLSQCKKTGVTGVIPAMILLLSGVAHASYIYDVNRSLACTNDCTGNITVEGTLKVDSLGTLTAGNFVDWMLTINSTNYPGTVLTPLNSEILMFGTGGSVVAAMDKLTITQPGAADPDYFIFAVSDTLDFPYSVLWQFQGGDLDPAQEIISNAPQSSSSEPFDQAVFTSPDNPLVVTLPAVVPEPVTLALLSIGLVGLGVARREKKA